MISEKKVSPTSDMQSNLVCRLSKLFDIILHVETALYASIQNIFKTVFFEKFNTFFS